MPHLELFKVSNELRIPFEVHSNKFEVSVNSVVKNFEYLRILAGGTSNKFEFLGMNAATLPT